MLDIDGFKAVNDTRGHQTGDRVLAAVASRLARRVRAEDVLGRWGGEEFVVLLPDLDAVEAAVAAEAFRQEVANEPIPLDGEELTVTVSVGWTAWDGEGAAELIDRADVALYAAKAAGRNCTRAAEPAVPSAASAGPGSERFVPAAAGVDAPTR